MPLVDTINTDIKEAMKSKDEVSLRGLRAVKAALLLAQTEKGAADVLAPEKEIQILQKLVKQRKESLEIYTSQNRPELAKDEADEIGVIERFLPVQMSETDISEALQKIITEVGAAGPSDMGKVMGAATKQLAGKADGKTISALVKTLLAG